jgi:hypothetical protein
MESSIILRADPYKIDFVHAFMEVESHFNPKAVGKLDDLGILQERPIMVREANRICKLTGDPRRFNLSDRLDSAKSVEIWYIVQGFWNPDYDLEKAAKIWNPTAGADYLQKIRRAL